MKKTILALAVAAMLAGCATPPKPVSAQGGSQLAGFATLAVWGTWEAELAPAYTRLAVLRHNAANRLDAGRISVQTAQMVQSMANEARAALDLSRRGPAKEPTDLQREQLADAIRLIERAEQLLER